MLSRVDFFSHLFYKELQYWRPETVSTQLTFYIFIHIHISMVSIIFPSAFVNGHISAAYVAVFQTFLLFSSLLLCSDYLLVTHSQQNI